MNLLEFEAKEIFREHGIPVPQGEVVETSFRAAEVAQRLNGPVAIKAQIAAGGRGKAGGILFAETPEEARLVAERMLGAEIRGFKVGKLLVERKLRIKKEMYFGITVDRSSQCYRALASREGGIDIEAVAAKEPENIIRFAIDPLYGFRPYHARGIAKALGYSDRRMTAVAGMFLSLYRLALEKDAEMTEINPLVETDDGAFIAADARLSIDDNSLFRHQDLRDRLFSEQRGDFSPEELEARKKGLAYVRLDGDIGVIGNGAGLTMATLDMINIHGGKPANFLDLGGGATSEQMSAALSLVFSDRRVKVLYINILGGITRCDEVARGILDVKQRIGFQMPIVVRLMGTNEEQGNQMLKKAGVEICQSLDLGAKRSAEIARSG